MSLCFQPSFWIRCNPPADVPKASHFLDTAKQVKRPIRCASEAHPPRHVHTPPLRSVAPGGSLTFVWRSSTVSPAPLCPRLADLSRLHSAGFLVGFLLELGQQLLQQLLGSISVFECTAIIGKVECGTLASVKHQLQLDFGFTIWTDLLTYTENQ
ncbi:hypothetical protein EYF80_002779 [Liparis tanakae]|uniref:Uncharacterized protein n=1 Tax=Liparis tanakae TaxID=230148 RepID=A0A4Z2JB17_9TELE|nr:hypothetical protein EYF80_002779 [Liparis tanakae]